MANHALPLVQACAIRIAALDAAGVPNPGANNLYTCNAFTEVTVTPNYTDGEKIQVKNACGGNCVNYTGDDSLDDGTVSITVCSSDPYLEMLLGGGSLLTDGDARGYASPPVGILTGNGVSIEVWAKRIEDGDLALEYPYMWFVIPKVKNLRHGPLAFSNGAMQPTFTGRALENVNWFDGPLNDWPVASDALWQHFETSSLPEITCLPTALAAS